MSNDHQTPDQHTDWIAYCEAEPHVEPYLSIGKFMREQARKIAELEALAKLDHDANGQLEAKIVELEQARERIEKAMQASVPTTSRDLECEKHLRNVLEAFYGEFKQSQRSVGMQFAMPPRVEDASAYLETRAPVEPANYQQDVAKWAIECFGEEDANNTAMRCHRFLEEALELFQAGGRPKAEAQELIDYVYGRPVGQVPQEVGGVMVTLAALCSAFKVDMKECGDTEQSRIWQKFDAIRAKHKAKPKFGALPVVETTDRRCESCHDLLEPSHESNVCAKCREQSETNNG